MAAARKTDPDVKADEKVDDQAVQLQPGDGVLLPDGGEAIYLGADGGEALLRVGTLHGDPVRRPLGQVSRVNRAAETRRHAKFRREALSRGEIKISEPASAE